MYIVNLCLCFIFVVELFQTLFSLVFSQFYFCAASFVYLSIFIIKYSHKTLLSFGSHLKKKLENILRDVEQKNEQLFKYLFPLH